MHIMSMTAEQLLSHYPPAVRRLTNHLRRVLLSAVPTFSERVLAGWRAISLRDPQAGHVCGLFLYQDRVRLYFEHGASLEDPAGLLRGGHMKRGRYLEFRSEKEVRSRAVQQLARQAVRLQSTA